ncbi:DUF1330 domain-containing protein [Pseudomonas fluorescens]|uniref:DUF1330 domain-containing protein n=1 Tax=Pseudomonas fluorescens TaxID=294 RepID=UPI0005AF168A
MKPPRSSLVHGLADNRLRAGSLEGEAPKRRRVVIEFASVEKAQAWYNSAQYTELRKVRQRSAKTDVYLIEGVPAR